MGENARCRATGEVVKVGTCENMYYLRADQVGAVSPVENSLNVREVRDELRFRFPFPDEDGVLPGRFAEPFRGMPVTLPGDPADWSGHSSVQFRATEGYVLNVPCPEGVARDGAADRTVIGHGLDGAPLLVARNGFQGARLVQQRYVGEELWGVVQCVCGAKWRLPLDAAADVAAQFVARGERFAAEFARAVARGETGLGTECGTARFWFEMARRLLAGYSVTVTR